MARSAEASIRIARAYERGVTSSTDEDFAHSDDMIQEELIASILIKDAIRANDQKKKKKPPSSLGRPPHDDSALSALWNRPSKLNSIILPPVFAAALHAPSFRHV